MDPQDTDKDNIYVVEVSVSTMGTPPWRIAKSFRSRWLMLPPGFRNATVTTNEDTAYVFKADFLIQTLMGMTLPTSVSRLRPRDCYGWIRMTMVH